MKYVLIISEIQKIKLLPALTLGSFENDDERPINRIQTDFGVTNNFFITNKSDGIATT